MPPTLLGTIQMEWLSIGTIDATAAGADSALGATERTVQDIKDLDNVVYYEVPKHISVLRARFLLATNNADVDIDIYEGRMKKKLSEDSSGDSALRRVVTLDVVAGQQTHTTTTKLFADTATEANDVTMKGLTTKTQTDHMAIVEWDLCGANIVMFHGFGTFDEDCEIEVCGYS